MSSRLPDSPRPRFTSEPRILEKRAMHNPILGELRGRYKAGDTEFRKHVDLLDEPYVQVTFDGDYKGVGASKTGARQLLLAVEDFFKRERMVPINSNLCQEFDGNLDLHQGENRPQFSLQLSFALPKDEFAAAKVEAGLQASIARLAKISEKLQEDRKKTFSVS